MRSDMAFTFCIVATSTTALNGNPIGSAGSIMSSEWKNGPPSYGPWSQYNDLDKQQIRLHLRL
jgi:hypothetical protein